MRKQKLELDLSSKAKLDDVEAAAEVQEQAHMEPGIQGAANPLLIDIILDKVFQYVVDSCDFFMEKYSTSASKELMSFRLVCKLWRDRATSALRKVSYPESFGDSSVFAAYEPNFIDPDETLSGFLEIMRTSTSIPVSSFIFAETFSVAESGSKQLFAEFLELCGPQTVELGFDAPSIINLTCPLEDFENFNFKLDKLKTLKIVSWESQRPALKDTQRGLFFQFVQCLLSAASALEEFDLFIHDNQWYWYEEKAEKCDELLKMLPPTVTSLKLMITCLHGSHFQTLTRREQTLKKLDLCVHSAGYFDSEFSDVYRFLDKESGSLTDLRIMEGHGFPPISEFPVMKELTYLYIDREGAGNNLFPTPISLPRIFPKLAKLEILGLSKLDCDKLVSFSDKMLSVAELFMPFKFPPSPWMTKAAEFFPNVKKLHMGKHENLDAVTVLRDVFRSFVLIEELYLVLYLNEPISLSVDSIFSGVTDDECRRILADERSNLSTYSLNDIQGEPSILNLKKLRKLEVESTGNRENHLMDTFTEFSAHCVFSKLATLEEMKLLGSIRMTTECKNILMDKLKKFDIKE